MNQTIWFWWGWICFIGWGITLFVCWKQNKDFKQLLEDFKKLAGR